jgi:hypothetical protein
MKLWEYMVVVHEVAPEELNKNGRQGWELVAVVNRGGPLEYYFKRPLPPSDALG